MYVTYFSPFWPWSAITSQVLPWKLRDCIITPQRSFIVNWKLFLFFLPLTSLWVDCTNPFKASLLSICQIVIVTVFQSLLFVICTADTQKTADWNSSGCSSYEELIAVNAQKAKVDRRTAHTAPQKTAKSMSSSKAIVLWRYQFIRYPLLMPY